MDLIKLISELRIYRAQVQEAIAAMEGLALRRGSRPRRKRVKPTARKAAWKTRGPRPMLVKPALVKTTSAKAIPVKRKRRRAASKKRSS